MKNNSKESIQLLTIISETRINSTKRTYAGYLCRCICGNLKTVRKHDYCRNKVTSCGCKVQNIKDEYIEDFIGSVFGRLTVLEATDKRKHGGIIWKCQCSCGNIVETTKNSLFYYKQSCGCLHKENTKERNAAKREKYIGKKYGYLEILNFDYKPDEYAHDDCVPVICKCHGCGKIITYPHVQYVTNIKSCGCKTAELHSLSNGGTGIPYENAALKEFLRMMPENFKWKNDVKKKYAYKCAILNKIPEHYEIHHIVPLHILYKTYKITMDNWKEFENILFDVNNGILLETSLHKEFHKKHGFNTNKDMLDAFISEKRSELNIDNCSGVK